MLRANLKTTTSRIVARRDNVVAVDFRNRTKPNATVESEPPTFPGASGIRVPQEPDTADHPSKLDTDDDVLRVACYPCGRRI